MTALDAAAVGLDAAVRAVEEVLVVLRPDPRGTGWAGSAADAAAHAGAVLAGRGVLLSGRAHGLADAVRAVAALHPVDPLDAAADDRLATALGAARDTSGAPSRGAAGPDPVTIAAWWAGLDAAERERLVRERPELVGGLDGVPAADRDRANRARLRLAEAAALAEERALAGGPLGVLDVLRGLGLPWSRVRTRLARLAALRASLDGPGRRLLAFDADPDGRVRAAVAAGDVDTAAHVGVFTPGFTADVRDLGGRLSELDAVRSAAGPDAAVVAWYGYDAPQWSGVADPAHSVAGEEAARVGGARLARFLEGIDAARPAAPPHLTALGHSYGTVTTAQALGAGADGVDDVVLLGSPGVPAGPGAAPGHAWVAEAAGDPVADAGWFGPDPNRAPGTTGLSTREVVLPDGRVLDGVTGHGGYLRPGSTSAHGVAAVVAGRPDDVVLDRGVGVGDRLRRLLEPAR